MPMFSLRRLLRRQRGVSYSLSFVLVVPLYLIVMLFTVEAALLLITRIGVQYAAYEGARAAVAWESAQPQELVEDRVKLAVVGKVAPFIGGRQRELDDVQGSLPPEAYEHASDWAEGMRKFQVPAVAAEPGLRRPYTRPYTPADAGFFERKFLSAWGRTDVTRTPATTARGPITVTVQVKAPLYMPVVSRFLDSDHRSPFDYLLQTTVTLPNDAPVSKDGTPEIGTLGIDYQSYRK